MDQSDSGEPSDIGRQDVAGLVRSVLRSTLRTIGRTSLGAFPLPNAQVIAKSTSNLGDLLDLRSHFKSAFESHRDGFNWRKLPHIVSSVVPGFVKTSICGTALFAVYDSLSVTRLGATDNTAAAFVCGVGGGLAHGFLVCAWDSAAAQLRHMSSTKKFSLWPQPKLLPYSFHGTLVAHSFVHGTLFWVYDTSRWLLEDTLGRELEIVATDLSALSTTTKRSFFGGTDKDNEHMILKSSPVHAVSKAICIFIAGAIAAIASDTVNYYVEAIETAGVRKGLKDMRLLPRPAARVLIPAAIPSSAGFLAYEFGKIED
jgi:hypothetical protein